MRYGAFPAEAVQGFPSAESCAAAGESAMVAFDLEGRTVSKAY
jgi:hypothetical protein